MGGPGQRLERVKLSTLSAFEEQIKLIEGAISNGTVELPALISLDMANRFGLKVGDSIILTLPSAGIQSPYKEDLTVGGIWVPKDPESDYWKLYSPEALSTRIIIPYQDWANVIDSLDRPVDEATWLLRFDGSTINSGAVTGLLSDIQKIKNRVSTLLPNTDLESSPYQALLKFQKDVRQLSASILAFSLPVFSLFLAFLFIVSGMLTQAQRNECAVMRARGFSRMAILKRYFIEYSFLSLIGLVIAIPMSIAIVVLMTKTKSFLLFSEIRGIIQSITPQSFLFGFTAACVCVILSLIPVWFASKETIISYKQERARAQKQVFWKKYYLDLVLLIFSLFSLFSQNNRADFIQTSSGIIKEGLYFIFPFLLMIALTLFVLRLLPLLLALLSKLAARVKSPEPVFVTRQLSRSYNNYGGVLILLILTLALATYTAAMAASLDQNLIDELQYTIGSDITFAGSGEFIPGLSGQDTSANPDIAQISGTWNFIPVETYSEFEGVLASTRVGSFNATMETGGRTLQGDLYGINWSSFSKVVDFRSDFADEPLNGLMNRLAITPNAVLVDRMSWHKLNLNPGDSLTVTLDTGELRSFNMTAVGVFDYFPTWKAGLNTGLVVANLDYIFESLGGIQPYIIWLKTEPSLNTAMVKNQANQMGINLTNLRDRRVSLDQALSQPNRQGILGLLSIGFIISTFLAIVSFGLYAISSLKDRAVQLGIFRAIGMSLAQLQRTVLGEMLFLVLSALGFGTLIGWFTSKILIKTMPVHLDSSTQVLPRMIQYDWTKVFFVFIVYGITLAVVSFVLMRVIERMKLFMAIKLGDTA